MKILLVVLFIFSGAVSAAEQEVNYDFDHKVHYKQKRLAPGHYQIEALQKEKTRFSQLATFLLRHAYKLCGSYDFELKILSGVEQFDDRQMSPNYIQPSLSANLVCPKK
ncbi:hypothetical protein tinsulaeT_11090 [Thalassotalea insulae]|uniref:Uncharacterized protein n=1 Tax=Thalassotalea insulae TaxID=2056778 RepID=A0ABQ6GRF3_9GAMM|nr:hypothetical protein [Thalassotalea insulae]GLX77769.1 hypothetical protein tinsulaeT_11090 [Thalassotalea insulae]